MAIEQLALNLIFGLGIGGGMAALSKWVSSDPWDGKLFVKATIIGAFSSLAIVQGVEGGVTESNVILILLAVSGLFFFANKGTQVLQKLSPVKKK